MNEEAKANILTRDNLDDERYRAGQIAALEIVLGDVLMLLEGLDEVESLDGLLSSTEETIKANEGGASRERVAGACSVIDYLKDSWRLGRATR